MLLGFPGGLGHLNSLASFEVEVDLADLFRLDRESLVLHAVSRLRHGLNLAFIVRFHSAFEPGSGRRQRFQNLKLERIGVFWRLENGRKAFIYEAVVSLPQNGYPNRGGSLSAPRIDEVPVYVTRHSAIILAKC